MTQLGQSSYSPIFARAILAAVRPKQSPHDLDQFLAHYADEHRLTSPCKVASREVCAPFSISENAPRLNDIACIRIQGNRSSGGFRCPYPRLTVRYDFDASGFQFKRPLGRWSSAVGSMRQKSQLRATKQVVGDAPEGPFPQSAMAVCASDDEVGFVLRKNGLQLVRCASF